MNGKHETRVLGRVLAVEETTHVSGARPTKPLYDYISAPLLEISYSSEYGTTTATNGVLIGNNTNMVPTHTSGT